MTQYLETRWYDFWKPLNADEGAKIDAFKSIRSRYSESNRAYHNFAHIEFCLKQLDEFRSLAKNLDELEVAIWYHDVVYEPARQDNEDVSTIFAIDHLRKLGMTRYFCSTVMHLIQATKHNFVLKDHDQQIIADIDLSGFGQEWPVVEAASRKIRFEYSWVPEDEYVVGRGKILRSFLDREQGLYYLPEFKTKYDAKARENIEQEIANLRELAQLKI